MSRSGRSLSIVPSVLWAGAALKEDGTRAFLRDNCPSIVSPAPKLPTPRAHTRAHPHCTQQPLIAPGYPPHRSSAGRRGSPATGTRHARRHRALLRIGLRGPERAGTRGMPSSGAGAPSAPAPAASKEDERAQRVRNLLGAYYSGGGEDVGPNRAEPAPGSGTCPPPPPPHPPPNPRPPPPPAWPRTNSRAHIVLGRRNAPGLSVPGPRPGCPTSHLEATVRWLAGPHS